MPAGKRKPTTTRRFPSSEGQNSGQDARGTAERNQAKRQLPAEMALRESELRYRTLLELSSDLIWTLDPEGKFTFVNRRCEEVSGYRFADFCGRTFSSLAVEEDLPVAWEVFQKVVQGDRQKFELRVKRPDGTVFRVEGNSAPIWQDNSIVGVVAFARDVTLERQMLEALRVNEERFRLVTVATNDGIWDYDLVTGKCWCNDRFEQLFGPCPMDTRGAFTWWKSIIHVEDRERVLSSFEQTLHSRHNQWASEHRFVLPDGTQKFVFVRAHIVRDAAGKAVRAVGTTLDLTERREAQEQLRRLSSQLLQAQEEERRRIARELHDSTAQKLAGVLMNLGLLEDTSREGSLGTREILTECLSGVEDCAQEIRTLSYLLHPPLLDELGLEVALDTYVTGFAQRSGVEVRLELDQLPVRPSHEASLALFRIVQESLTNTLRHSGSRTASIKLAGIRDRVILEVCDEGRGMTPELLAQFSGQGAWLGVGIMSMRERLRQLSGTLEIDSSSDGTTIRAIIPVTSVTT